MNEISFPGQQTDERILYFARPHPVARYVSLLKVVFFAFFFLFISQVLAGSLPPPAIILRFLSIILFVFFILAGWWWGGTVYQQSGMYITDRRIVKFSPLSPFQKTVRTLFWDEVVKCKTYRKKPLLEKLLGIGSIEVHARSQDKDNVDIDGLIYHEDIANYIDKILYTYKTKPSEIQTFRAFIPKPKGQRY